MIKIDSYTNLYAKPSNYINISTGRFKLGFVIQKLKTWPSKISVRDRLWSKSDQMWIKSEFMGIIQK